MGQLDFHNTQLGNPPPDGVRINSPKISGSIQAMGRIQESFYQET